MLQERLEREEMPTGVSARARSLLQTSQPSQYPFHCPIYADTDLHCSCPYLTAVGGTTLPAGANVKTDAETAVTRLGSGGGFSNIYSRPSYQQAAVSAYLTNTPPPYQSYSGVENMNIGAGGGIYNNGGRGYPDVSAVGDNIVIFNKGAPTLIGGTSASAPIFASILNRINEERLAAGKSTIGFVNPTLVSL